MNEYKNTLTQGHAQDTFAEMRDLQQLFAQDSDINSAQTMIRGDCFCGMIGLMVELAQSMRRELLHQITEL
jgi:hypothetical protein